jgi:hypothetical protein
MAARVRQTRYLGCGPSRKGVEREPDDGEDPDSKASQSRTETIAKRVRGNVNKSSLCGERSATNAGAPRSAPCLFTVYPSSRFLEGHLALGSTTTSVTHPSWEIRVLPTSWCLGVRLRSTARVPLPLELHPLVARRRSESPTGRPRDDEIHRTRPHARPVSLCHARSSAS